MKKQFKFPVAIEDYTQETIEFCKDLEYRIGGIDGRIDLFPYLTNNSNNNIGVVTDTVFVDDRTLCNWKTEKELCKALLAATEGNIVYEYEYYYDLFDNLLIARSDFPLRDYKKPTLTQLLTHFRNKPMDKKIIGYECPMDLYNGKIKKGDVINHNHFLSQQQLKCLKVKAGEYEYEYLPLELVLTWKPIYEEDKLFLDDEKTIEVKDYQGCAEIGGIVYNNTRLREYESIIRNDRKVDIYILNKKLTLEKLEKIKEMLNK
jgi:hypothetical protein